MAQYQIKHACGHETTEQIYGTNVHDERTRQANALAARPCEDCRRAAALESAKQRSAALPALTGSEKQVAWALTIRDKQLKLLSENAAKLSAHIASFAAQYPAQAEILSAVVTDFVNAETVQDSAKYWIDARYRALAAELSDKYDEVMQPMQDEITAQSKKAQVETPKPAPAAPASTADMDDAAAEQMADKTWARVTDWYDASEVQQTRRELAKGEAYGLRGMIGDLLAVQPVNYSPAGIDRVLAILTAREATP